MQFAFGPTEWWWVGAEDRTALVGLAATATTAPNMLAAAFQVAGAKGSLSRQPLSPVWWAAQVTQMSYNAFVSIKEAGLLLPSLLQSLSKFTGGVDLGSEWVTEEMYEQWCAEVRRRATHLECVPGAITRKVIHAPERPAAGWPPPGQAEVDVERAMRTLLAAAVCPPAAAGGARAPVSRARACTRTP